MISVPSTGKRLRSLNAFGTARSIRKRALRRVRHSDFEGRGAGRSHGFCHQRSRTGWPPARAGPYRIGASGALFARGTRPDARGTRNAALASGNRQIGRAHVCTPVTNAQLVCRLLLETKKAGDHLVDGAHAQAVSDVALLPPADGDLGEARTKHLM